MKQKIYAYFLPQFYPTPENDKYWGKDFTDWESTKKAKPLFQNHLQPYKPVLNGEYCLNNESDLKTILDYTEDINIRGVIYWHYWFGNGFKTLEKVPQLHLGTKSINQSYFFAWANANWDKSWQGDDKTIIFKQQYDLSQVKEHFNYLMPFFKDHRYIKYNGNFLFQVNNLISKEVLDYIKKLNDFVYKHFSCQIHFLIPASNAKVEISGLIFSYTGYPPGDIYSKTISYKFQKLKKIFKFQKHPIIIDSQTYLSSFKNSLHKYPKTIPCILSGWDSTARYKNNGVVVQGDISKLVSSQLNIIKESNYVYDFILLKAINEWAEGNVIEPYKLQGKIYEPGLILKNNL